MPRHATCMFHSSKSMRRCSGQEQRRSSPSAKYILTADGWPRDLASIRYVSVGIVGAVTAPMMLILFLMVRRAANLVSTYQASLRRNVVEATSLAAQNDRLRRVADDARLEAANSNENLLARIGQDLHDGPIQLVSLLMLKLTDPSSHQQAASGSHGSGAQALTSRILAELRDISTGLVLPQLEGLTPNEILRLAVQNHEDATGTKVSSQIGDLPDRSRAAADDMPVQDRAGRTEQRFSSWEGDRTARRGLGGYTIDRHRGKR